MICGKAAALSTSYPQGPLRLIGMGVMPGALGLKSRWCRGPVILSAHLASDSVLRASISRIFAFVSAVRLQG